MKSTALTFLALACGTTIGLAQSTSTSANYKILHAPPGVGGGSVGNGATIAAQISVGDVFAGGISNLTPGGARNKPNYIGQLYDVTGLTVTASPATVDEGATRQLGADADLDDLTVLVLAGGDLQWSVTLGPLSGIDAAGLATAGLVYADTPATVEGSYLGIDDDLVLTVLNVDPDNLDDYAGDGLDDAWQVNFFGDPPNADAAPGANPDEDFYDNEFEFLTGYDPTDAGDFFIFEVVSLAGTTATLELSKIIPGTRYHLERTADLEQSDPWSEISNFTTLSEVFDHQVTDPAAAAVRWFYRIGVSPE